MSPEAALAIARFGHDAAAMSLWGAFGFLAALVPAGLATAVARRLAPWRRAAIAVVLATTVVALPLQAATIGDGWAAALDGGTLRAMLFDTNLGPAWGAQAGAAVLLGAMLAAPIRRTAATAFAAGLALAALPLSGHAAMQDSWPGVIHRANDAVHLLSAGGWLGALTPLLLLLGALDDPATSHDAGTALRRFSAAGHVAVALVIVTGCVNMAFILGPWPPIWATPYRRLLAAKIALVAVMTALALMNRYVLVPRLARDRGRTLHRLRQATLAEVGLGMAAIALVAVFGLLDPA